MSGEPVELSVLRALAPKSAQARFCRRVRENECTCSKGQVYEVEVVVGEEALRRLCAGHFPGRPIVPGSHLVALMVDVARLLAGAEVREVLVRRAVFRAPVGPEERLWVRARAGKTAGRVDAEVLRGGESAGDDAPAERTVVASARLEVVR